MIIFISNIIRIRLLYKQSTNYNRMNFKDSASAAHHILSNFDDAIWDNIALKAVEKMPKYKLSKETNTIINNITKLNQKVNSSSGTVIVEEKDPDNNLKENYIVGSSKMVHLINRLMISQIPKNIKREASNKYKARSRTGTVSTLTQQQQRKTTNSIKEPSSLFRLTLPQKAPEINNDDDTLRLLKDQDQEYNKQMEQKYRQLRARSMEFSTAEKQKYKEVKKFTYDYEGKLISLKDNNREIAKIISIKSQLETQSNPVIKKKRTKTEKSIQNIQQILNKRIVRDEVQKLSVMETRNKLVKQREQKQQQDRIQKMGKYIKSIGQSHINFNEIFKDDHLLSSGVCIIDKYSRAKITGLQKDKDNISTFTLSQFKSQAKGIQTFKQKLLIKKPKNGLQIKYKTQYTEHGSHNQFNLQSLRQDQKSNLTSLARYIQNKGKIIVKDEKLYTENFIEHF